MKNSKKGITVSYVLQIGSSWVLNTWEGDWKERES